MQIFIIGSLLILQCVRKRMWLCGLFKRQQGLDWMKQGQGTGNPHGGKSHWLERTHQKSISFGPELGSKAAWVKVKVI